jgi:hypothetical protein
VGGPGILKAGSGARVDTPPPHDDLTTSLFARFADIDKDKDGFASKKEIEGALTDTSFTGDAGAMLATLWATFGDFEDFSDDEWGIENDGITKADATAYDRLREKKDGNKKVETVTNTFAFAKGKISAANAGGTKTVFRGAPDALSVQQSVIGDCYFLATLAGIAKRDPAQIRAFITSTNPGGPFDVKFPGAPKAISVPMPTDAEVGILSSSNGIWLTILELAYAGHLFGEKFATARGSSINEINQGRAVGSTIPLLTGRSADDDSLDFTKQSETRDKLKKAFAGNKIVVAGVRGSIPGLFNLGDGRRGNGLPMGHAYSVLGFDSAKKEVKLRNPWGNAGTKFEAEFTLTLDEFESNFNTIAYEQ